MSCVASQGVVFCQMGYLGAMFACLTVGFVLLSAYVAGRYHGKARARAKFVGKDP